MQPLNWKVTTWSLALFASVMFALCVVYGLVVPMRFHAPQILEAVLPGFRWLSPGASCWASWRCSCTVPSPA